jgi:hypothetical protein
MEIEKNDEDGFQVVWRDILLTIRPNEHHGISGSIAVKDEKGKIRLLSFHGSPGVLFPMKLHEETLRK